MGVVKQEIHEGILRIQLSRPDKLNALNEEVLTQLTASLTHARQTAEIRGVLLTGEGKAFCAGADIHRLAACNAHSGYEFALMGQSVCRLLETLGKPSIAAVNGYAFGGGCELAMAASIRIAATTAQFAQPEVKLGVIPGYGGTQRLARLVGKGRALDLCLTGRTIDAETAQQWGLVSAVVGLDVLLEKAKQMLDGILAMAPLAVRGVMEAIDYGYNLPLSEAMHLEALHFSKTCASADKQEGTEAFFARRTPHFEGE